MPKFLPLLLTLLLSGCSAIDYFKNSDTEESQSAAVLSAEEYYDTGLQAMKARRYIAAGQNFQDLERHYPNSPQTARSQMYRVYSHYKAEEYEETVAAAERFIRHNPRHHHVSYAYYMRGLAFYQRISDAYRDQGFTREAMAAFEELINRFPGSDYADQAKRMLELCRDRLAEQEMVVGRYYLDRGEFIAAMNRFKLVVEDPVHSRTPYVEEALFSMVFSATKLGMGEEARNYASVLGHNFPDGKFYNEAVILMSGEGEMTPEKMADLRRGIEEGSLIKRFFEGLRPGLPDMGNNTGL